MIHIAISTPHSGMTIAIQDEGRDRALLTRTYRVHYPGGSFPLRYDDREPGDPVSAMELVVRAVQGVASGEQGE